MGFFNWLSGKMLGGKTVEITAQTVEEYLNQEALTMLMSEEFLIHAAINLIANCISKCEFKTLRKGEEFYGDEYYIWNYEPNINQNSSQFIQELVTRLLYNNECLVIESRGQLLIAESFSKEEYALNETIFSGVTRNGFTFERTFTMSEVLYFRLNNKNIRYMLTNLCNGYNQLLQEAIEKYEKAGGEKGILTIDSHAAGMKYGNKTFEEVFEELMSKRFEKFFKNRNAVLPLFSGFSYVPRTGAEQSKKSTSEVKDITDLTDEVLMRVSQAFNIPVSLLKGDVSDVKEITKNFLTFCIDPICDMISGEINRKRYGRTEVLKKNYVKVDTSCTMHIDIFEIAEKIDKLIASGTYCIDELRRKLGETELGTEEAKTHFITKNYTKMEGETVEDGKKENNVPVRTEGTST